MSVGGAGLAATLIKLDLIDEYRLFVHPVVLGGGTPYFLPLDRAIELELLETRTFGSRVVLLRYRRVDEALAAARLRAAGCVFAEEEARLILAAARTPDELDAMVERRAAACRSSRSSAGPSSAGFGSPWIPGSSCRAAAPSSWSARPPLLGTPWALARPGPIVVDLCCGTGAIGAAIAAAVDGAEVHAADIDPAAVRCARRNVPGTVYQGDLYAPLPARLRGRVAVLAANVPYVPTAEIGFLPPEARAMSRWPRWTVARTASTCCAASRPARPAGWRPAVTC